MVEGYAAPKAMNTLPELKKEFKDNDEKGVFVNELLTISTKAMTDADMQYTQFNYAQAHVEYLVSLDGFLHLLKTCSDDANFTTYLK